MQYKRFIYSALLAVFVVGGMLALPRRSFAADSEPKTLPNGLRVIVRERHTLPLVAVDVWLRAGSREERPDETGCAHFLEHALFRGTENHAAGDIDFAVESLGGIISAATGPDYAHFSVTVPPDSLHAVLRLLADLVRHAALPEEAVSRERGPILDELAARSANLDERLVERCYAAAFDTHPYRTIPGGTEKDIAARSRDTLAAFYRRCYAPERCTLVLAGDVTAAQANLAAAAAFEDWKPSETKEATIAAEPEITNSRTAEETINGITGRIALAWRVPPANDAQNTAIAHILAACLGESDGYGRLTNDALHGTNAQVRYTPRRDSSLFLVTASVPPKASPAQIEDALHTAITKLLAAPISPAEWNAARQQVLAQMRYDGAANAGTARQWGYADITKGDTPEAFARRLPTVSPADGLRFARRYFDSNHSVTVRLLPPR